MSAKDLADLVGWKRDSSAKTHYSKLGRRLAEQLDLGTCIGCIDTGHDLDERTFAAAVFTGQTMNFS